MTRDLIVPGSNLDIIIPPGADRDSRYRLGLYVKWMDASGRGWAAPDLKAYRDYLLHEYRQQDGSLGLAPQTVMAHLAGIRSRYKDLLLDRSRFFDLVPSQDSFAERKALVDELITRIENAIDPRAAPVRRKTRQDRPDTESIRLTHHQAMSLLSGPDPAALIGLRDLAILSVLLCTGIREAELSSLEVPDLRQHLGGELSIHVREGKGAKERLIPYGAMDWCLPIVDTWLKAASISGGPAFRGVRKGDHVRKTPITERAIQYIVARYPVVIDGDLVAIRPHDCRRTYARWLYDAGVKVDAIRLNLGHESIEQTFHYIGPSNADQRRPPALFHFDLTTALRQANTNKGV